MHQEAKTDLLLCTTAEQRPMQHRRAQIFQAAGLPLRRRVTEAWAGNSGDWFLGHPCCLFGIMALLDKLFRHRPDKDGAFLSS